LIGLELPLTVQFSAFIIGERLGQGQTLMIFLIFIGIVLTVTTRLKQLHVHRRLMEKGVALACVAAIGMAAINVLFAVSSRQFSPILSLWFIHLFLAVILGIYSWADGTLDTIIASAKEHPKLIVLQGIFDNGAWLAYSYAVLTIPVGVAVGISESYIAIAAILGITANRERLRRHQVIGLILVVIGVVTLAAITD
jgi:drug/metabolite transporter (DMT)-like permease